MTTNVADYIASGNTDEIYRADRVPKDLLADNWYVSCYYHVDGYYIIFDTKKRNWDLSIKLCRNGKSIFLSGGNQRSREYFLDLLRDSFPIPFEWCLFNLDLIGA